MSQCSFVPPYLLERIAGTTREPALAESLRRTRDLDDVHRLTRELPAEGAAPAAAAAPRGPRRSVATAEGSTDLPGRILRDEDDPPRGDAAVDEVFDALGATWRLYADAFGRDSVDGAGLPLEATVHYGTDYDNAFWNGSRVVVGDGDRRVLHGFSAAVDVIGHELAHGLVQSTAQLEFAGQPGALHESVADVFGALARQHALGQTADEADWLVGAGLFTSRVRARALRSLAAPGTAYDDPALGHDPQPARMSGYVETVDDNGGAHINSGIPNHAFYLAARMVGGHAWKSAGQVWYDALVGGRLPVAARFAEFAWLTIDAAHRRFGTGSAELAAVRDAWDAVEVVPEEPYLAAVP